AGERDAADASVVTQLAALKRMTVVELKAKWESLFGTPAPNNSRSYLELRLSYRIQELTLGGLSRETRRTLDLLADEIEGRAGRGGAGGGAVLSRATPPQQRRRPPPGEGRRTGSRRTAPGAADGGRGGGGGSGAEDRGGGGGERRFSGDPAPGVRPARRGREE